MKISCLALFALGYVVGAKAGRERYEKIVELVQRLTAPDSQLSARDLVLEYADSTAARGEARSAPVRNSFVAR